VNPTQTHPQTDSNENMAFAAQQKLYLRKL